MKGVMLGIAPDARLVDISHEVEPYQIAQAGYLLSQSWRYFPKGTTHVAVVDPGVGSARRAIVAEAEGHRFVLPDNGLLSLAGVEPDKVRAITEPTYMRHPVSRTFHGRDIFAPAAAHINSRVAFEFAGGPISDWIRLPRPENQVLHVDRFGNIVTSFRSAAPLIVGGKRISQFSANYADADRSEPFLIEGSGGYVEISMREASAAAALQVRVGDPVALSNT
jgi:S-adenosylmethionine hydrolase